MDVLSETVESFIRFNLFSKLDSGNPVINMLISTLFMMYIPIIFNKLRNGSLRSIFSHIYFFRYNTITLQGMRTISVGGWQTRTQNIFSLRFRSLWYYIQQINTDSIYSLKEYPLSENKRDQYDEADDDEYNQMQNDIFVVNQISSFKLSDNIWCKVTFDQSDLEGTSTAQKTTAKIETITICIYSTVLKTDKLEKFINEVSQNYIDIIFKHRQNDLFIYSLLSFKTIRDEPSMPEWDECKFNSNRHFDTIFFDKKDELLSKINFFNNNREWYDKEGHPYTLGIALHGPPGTGKTSVIKCIANQLRRHLVVIPLSKIKTQRQFHQCFFDQTYTHKNAKYDIGFENKIIVLEDIDCMSDIIMERKANKPDRGHSYGTHDDSVMSKHELLDAIRQGMKPDDDHSFLKLPEQNNDTITLSFLLNIIDGIRETPGRILIISSNHYDKIDHAFKRPGRIDVSLEMKNASIDIIKEIVHHYYQEDIPEEILKKLKGDIISPATLVNLRFKSKDFNEYLKHLESLCSIYI